MKQNNVLEPERIYFFSMIREKKGISSGAAIATPNSFHAWTEISRMVARTFSCEKDSYDSSRANLDKIPDDKIGEARRMARDLVDVYLQYQ